MKRIAECSKQGNNLCLKVFHEENRKIKSQLVIKSITKYEKKKFNDNIQYVLDQICSRKKSFFVSPLRPSSPLKWNSLWLKCFCCIILYGCFNYTCILFYCLMNVIEVQNSIFNVLIKVRKWSNWDIFYSFVNSRDDILLPFLYSQC